MSKIRLEALSDGGIPINSWVAFALYSLVAIIWLAPDRRFEMQPIESSET